MFFHYQHPYNSILQSCFCLLQENTHRNNIPIRLSWCFESLQVILTHLATRSSDSPRKKIKIHNQYIRCDLFHLAIVFNKFMRHFSNDLGIVPPNIIRRANRGNDRTLCVFILLYKDLLTGALSHVSRAILQ